MHANAQLIAGESLKFYFNCNKIVVLNVCKGQHVHMKKALLWRVKGPIEERFTYLALGRYLINVSCEGKSGTYVEVLLQ